MKISLAVAALLYGAQAINIMTVQQASTLSEETRYIGSNGQTINLAQTEGHLKLDLQRIKKYSEPRPIDGINVQLDSKCASTPTQSSGQTESEGQIDDVTHCPINKPGEKVMAHII